MGFISCGRRVKARVATASRFGLDATGAASLPARGRHSAATSCPPSLPAARAGCAEGQRPLPKPEGRGVHHASIITASLLSYRCITSGYVWDFSGLRSASVVHQSQHSCGFAAVL